MAGNIKKENKKNSKIGPVEYGLSLFTEYDSHLFKEGNHFSLFEKLGSMLTEHNGKQGAYFAVWAPNAKKVSVMGEFNHWKPHTHPLSAHPSSAGIWEGFIPGIEQGMLYKFHIESNHNGYKVDKGDPYAFFWEISPQTASRVWDLAYTWQDTAWMKKRKEKNNLHAPISIYEVHLGSWRRVPEENNRPLTYRETAPYLAEHITRLGFTHVEFLPVMEHPFYGSWGYQTVGYFAPTSRYGTPQDFMYLIEYLHQHDIGVILDWVPSHFPSDEHGVGYFDGTYLYEHQDPRQGFHPDWKSMIFNCGRNEVRNFLISNAVFWLDKYHVDGLRVDAVASMLYLDYSRKEGEWVPNIYGGRENLGSISFLKRFNEMVHEKYPDTLTIAEESTSWPMVSRPVYLDGLGFDLKWNMGWMHDMLTYISKDPIYRKYDHNQLTFSIWYAFFENFVLPISHDEVVHGKCSVLQKMAGDEWQKFANLRTLYGFMYTHPGKKLLFMGNELAQWSEWNHDASIDWHLLNFERHQQILLLLTDLNNLYVHETALHELDCEQDGFEWIDCNDMEKSVISYIRKGRSTKDIFLVVCNFTPVPRRNYRVGVPAKGFWQEVLNSDAKKFGGAGFGNFGGCQAVPVPIHGKNYSLSVVSPPLSIIVFKNKNE
ncbi:MAG: 1,4-alpha-glucan branching protein GlgB [bacterium]